jgi:hypothetical protein
MAGDPRPRAASQCPPVPRGRRRLPSPDLKIAKKRLKKKQEQKKINDFPVIEDAKG